MTIPNNKVCERFAMNIFVSILGDLVHDSL
jgi:hypothetical protein